MRENWNAATKKTDGFMHSFRLIVHKNIETLYSIYHSGNLK